MTDYGRWDSYVANLALSSDSEGEGPPDAAATEAEVPVEERPQRPQLQAAWRKCVIGARVARTLGLELGSVVTPVHGKAGEFGSHEHPEAACEIVGVLAPTNSPIDSTIYLPLGIHLLIDGHDMLRKAREKAFVFYPWKPKV